MERSLALALALMVCFLPALDSAPSEYQLDSTVTPCEALRNAAGPPERRPQCTHDGRFRPVQCSGRGQECWCVDAKGQELPGTRTNKSVPQCASPCHLQSSLRCSPSGDFLPVQCDSGVGQCWCVDRDGMEIYGTRQRGTPHRCPGSCAALSRRLLHTAVSSSASPQSSPPQCSEDGDFLPVQCRLVNMTDRRELDILHAFNTFPQAFSNFKSFRKFFPGVSAYCFCSDSRGREMTDTGAELLTSDVYDSAFSGPGVARSFAESTVFKVLHRRTLGLRLALVGKFRCPSACEEERRASTSEAFVPSCEEDGNFSSKQCQQGGQCWCVDSAGAELPGTRRRGDSLVCGNAASEDCASLRRTSLSRLFSGPLEARLPVPSSPGVSVSCPALLRSVKALLPQEADPRSSLSVAADVLHGLFPSAGGALEALAATSPGRLQEFLFGGKFLKNAATFNLSRAVGTRGALRADDAASPHQNLVLAVSRAMEDRDFLAGVRLILTGASGSASVRQALTPTFRACAGNGRDDALSVFVPDCAADGSFMEVQCQGGECWCVTPRGGELAGTRTSGGRPRCPSLCEKRRAAALQTRDEMAAGADVQVPACSPDGGFLPLQCGRTGCFCVDRQGAPIATQSPGGALECPDADSQKPRSPTGECSRALQEVAAFRQEVSKMVALSNSSHLPAGYSYLLAEGVRLTSEELGSEEAQRVSDWLLSRSKAALRMAAYSTLQMLQPVGRLSYQPFSPECDDHGEWRPTQCYHGKGQCWCVDEHGEYVPGSLSERSIPPVKCLTRCQRARSHGLLSGWMKASNDTDDTAPGYRPHCDEDGHFSVLQTEGAAGWCVHPVSGERLRDAAPGPDGRLSCPSQCQLQGLQCGPDGSFAPLRCDATTCWCVSEDGREVAGTQELRATGRTPSCDCPACPATVARGTLLCRPAQDGRQSCELVCERGYVNSLPARGFKCDTSDRRWEGDLRPLPGACQMITPPQRMLASQTWSLAAPCSDPGALQSQLFHDMTTGGLCSAQLPASRRSIALCDDSSVRVRCHNNALTNVTAAWTVLTSDLPTSELPDLHDAAVFLNISHLLERFELLLTKGTDIAAISRSDAAPSLRAGCSRSYRLSDDGRGCVVCPAGSYSAEGACLLCPEGSYQDAEGRDSCDRCPAGSSSSPGAFSVNQCVTDCQRRGLRCSSGGDFLPAQADLPSGRWSCFNSKGAELEWTRSNTPLKDDECSVLRRFEAVARSEVIFGAQDTEVLQSTISDLRKCAQACALNASCHHVALFAGQCQIYSTHPLNTRCNISEQVKGFLGNGQAEFYDQLKCLVRVKGVASDTLVLRKIGAESTSDFVRSSMSKAESGVFRTWVFGDASLADAHRFCETGCRRDDCCQGFVLNRNSFSGGSLLCGWLRSPPVLTCGQRDWDVTGRGAANRICGAGLAYNKGQRNFLFDFGGQKFTIDESALPASTASKKDYQASLVDFQAVYLASDPSDAASCALDPVLTPPLDGSVQMKFSALPNDDVSADAGTSLPVLSFLLNKKTFTSQQALLWCLTRCDGEAGCSLARVDSARSPAGFHDCSMFPDTRVCGAYDTPLRRPCRVLLDGRLNGVFSKKVDLLGPVKSFYQRVPFQKMVSYSVRRRVNVEANLSLPDGFVACERRCDEDACCRGFGFIRDSKDGGTGVVCVILISLGIQTCTEDRQSSWSVGDCRQKDVHTAPTPFGWYQKPVNQWTSSPGLCPAFTLPTLKNNVSTDDWTLLPESSLLLDPSSPSYDVIHISRDIATDPDRTRDWCLQACREAETCAAVSLAESPSATRCVLYPDTTLCGLSSAPDSGSPAFSCRLVVREPAPRVYLRTVPSSSAMNVAIEGHGTLRGVIAETASGSDRKRVLRFLGVPYARPPTGSLRFREALPPDWTGTWDATRMRSICVQAGRADGDEDCLYLNVFRPAATRGRLPVLVFFVNAASDRGLDGSALAAVGNVVVVTATYRTAALGFLSAGSSDLPGNYGASDQKAALLWVRAHISALGGDESRVTVGAERGGADIISLRLLSRTPLFQRMLLMGGSLFSPSSWQTPSSARRQALQLAAELNCPTDDDGQMATCLRATPVRELNTAQTKLLAASGPFRSWSPVRPQDTTPDSLRRVDLLLGTSQHDGLIERARDVKDFTTALFGGSGGKTAFYEALSRSLGGASGNSLLKDAAAWFYSLDHSSAPAGYNLFSRALDNATRDLFIICPTLRMASHYAASGANVFLYHQPATVSRAEPSAPPDMQLFFGVPLRPDTRHRHTDAERRLSLAAMSYVANFVRSGNPNPPASWPASSLPRWRPVLSSLAPPAFLELSPDLRQKSGLRERSCSFWNGLAAVLARHGQLGAEPTFNPELPVDAPDGRSQSDKDAYN
ncbi:thyroglobulin [Corythoichthys intestinalis]|uniref:thyroglobulin n=1 Tax=Corythoichthys intestinalis TaxID=161448 RepID=UPI0025A57718|nr:thyroglobulin [Corythoichthys intestinalis]XP_061789793.1 thyroglobulin-like [Nerophis lumbriciformis]